MDTIITIDLSKEVIPAEVIAILQGLKETTAQKQAKENIKKKEAAKIFEVEARTALNIQLLEKGYAFLCPLKSDSYYREDIIQICEKLKNEFLNNGYTVGGWGEYSPSNKRIYELRVCV